MQQLTCNPGVITSEERETGRLLFTKTCEFVIGCADLTQLPHTNLTEIAFAGRSNVGKSSLINALTNRKTLARISNTPGRTREINFFNLGELMMISDLPGYGYARASKKKISQWTALVNRYLSGRANLRRTFILIDSRHGLKTSDYAIIRMLDATAQSYQLILTKCDKVKPAPLLALVQKIKNDLNQHPAAFPEVCVTSSKTGLGIPYLQATIGTLAPAEELS